MYLHNDCYLLYCGFIYLLFKLHTFIFPFNSDAMETHSSKSEDVNSSE